MPPRWLQTTAIDYPNSLPHCGTAFEKLGADIQARYRRMEGFEVEFLMGNDENTAKVYDRAKELNILPNIYCDRMAEKFIEIWKSLGIIPTKFVQTTDCGHAGAVREAYDILRREGLIYDDRYSGYFCAGCEEYRTEQQAIDHKGICPNHNTEYIKRSEPAMFFALSKFKDRLVKFHTDNTHWIEPAERHNEIMAGLDDLKDVCITRMNQHWGISVPGVPEFRFYVWFDALLSYITSTSNWPADVQFIGKDITRFHCILWPALLWGLGKELPKQIFAHGFIKIGENKMSKSLGNSVSIDELIKTFSPDGVRYCLMATCPFAGDSEFTLERFKAVYTSDLVNNYGNLVSRVINLAKMLNDTRLSTFEKPFLVPVTYLPLNFQKLIENYDYHLVLQGIMEKVLTPANQMLEQEAPWKYLTQKPEDAAKVVGRAIAAIRTASILLKPFIPKTAGIAYKAFSWLTEWDTVHYGRAVLKDNPTYVIPKVDQLHLFPRLGKE